MNQEEEDQCDFITDNFRQKVHKEGVDGLLTFQHRDMWPVSIFVGGQNTPPEHYDSVLHAVRDGWRWRGK